MTREVYGGPESLVHHIIHKAREEAKQQSTKTRPKCEMRGKRPADLVNHKEVHRHLLFPPTAKGGPRDMKAVWEELLTVNVCRACHIKMHTWLRRKIKDGVARHLIDKLITKIVTGALSPNDLLLIEELLDTQARLTKEGKLVLLGDTVFMLEALARCIPACAEKEKRDYEALKEFLGWLRR
jgi:hypothetical protein